MHSLAFFNGTMCQPPTLLFGFFFVVVLDEQFHSHGEYLFPVLFSKTSIIYICRYVEYLLVSIVTVTQCILE